MHVKRTNNYGSLIIVYVTLIVTKNCNNTLCFLKDDSVLVCKEHRTAVVNLNTHLLQHHNVPTATQKQIIERFDYFATVSPAEIELPEEPAQPIDELTVVQDMSPYHR